MVEKYLDAFPFSFSYVPKGQDKLFFLKDQNDQKILHLLDLSKSTDHKDAEPVCGEDFSKRSFRPVEFDAKKGRLYIYSDDDNRENFNIFTLDLSNGDFQQLTDCTYCGIYGITPDFKTMIYGDRYKTENGIYHTWLYHKDLETGEKTPILEDEGWEYRLAWGQICFAPEDNGFVIEVDWKNRRNKRNLLFVDLETKKTRKLLPADKESPWSHPLPRVIENGDVYFMSDISGNENLYHLNLRDENPKPVALTNFTLESNGFRFYGEESICYMLLSDYANDATVVKKIELNNANIPEIQTATLKGAHQFPLGDALWIYSSNMDSPARLSKYSFEEELKAETTVPLFVGDEKKLVHNTYNYIEYESFDGKKVSAYLSLPKGEIKGAVITAFYGGTNYYSWQSQLFAELGLAELSPAVRGSWTHGLEWQQLIKGDLGGDEIVDLHWGAKYLEKELGLKPSQIGLEGGSHGGYSVLRGLTMPEGFKGREGTSYPYGFGVCWAGFADLEDFYKTSNIPDWLVDMLGPYEGNEEKYRDRSPIHHFENLKSPLFISHGTNDPRVSPTSMEGFLEKLRSSDKPHVIHTMSGLGHGAGGREEKLQLYAKMVEFLAGVFN